MIFSNKHFDRFLYGGWILVGSVAAICLASIIPIKELIVLLIFIGAFLLGSYLLGFLFIGREENGKEQLREQTKTDSVDNPS